MESASSPRPSSSTPDVAGQGASSSRRQRLLFTLLLVLVVLIVFAPSCSRALFLEDDRLLQSAAQLERWFLAFAPNSLGLPGAFGRASFWRPLTTLSYGLEIRAGWGPLGHHATNIVLHAISAVLVQGFLWRWAGRLVPGKVGEFFAFAGALVWALLPARCESVGWVSGRADVLGTLVLLASCEAFARVRRPSAKIAWALLGTGLAVLAKETMFVAPVYFALEETKSTDLRRWARSVPFLTSLALSAGALVYRFQAGFGGKGQQYFLDQSLLTRAAVSLETLGFSLRALVFPFWSSLFPGVFEFDEERTIVLLPLAGGAGLVGLLVGVTLFLKVPRARIPLVMVLVGLLPVLNLIPTGMESRFSDRYTYLPHVGMILGLLVSTAEISSNRPRSSRFFALGLTGVLGILCSYRASLFGHVRELLDFEISYGSRPRVLLHEAAFRAAEAGDYFAARDFRLMSAERTSEIGIGDPVYYLLQAARMEYEGVGEQVAAVERGMTRLVDCGLRGGEGRAEMPFVPGAGGLSFFCADSGLRDAARRDEPWTRALALLLRARRGGDVARELDVAEAACPECSFANLELAHARLALGDSERAEALCRGETTLRFRAVEESARYQNLLRRLLPAPEKDAAVAFVGLAPVRACALLRDDSSGRPELMGFRAYVCGLAGEGEGGPRPGTPPARELRSAPAARYASVRGFFSLLPERPDEKDLGSSGQ